MDAATVQERHLSSERVGRVLGTDDRRARDRIAECKRLYAMLKAHYDAWVSGVESAGE